MCRAVFHMSSVSSKSLRESSARFYRLADAEGETAPETLRPTDRRAVTLWKAASDPM